MTHCVQAEAAAENVHAPNLVPYERIRIRAICGGRAAISSLNVYGVTCLQPEEASAWLRRRVEVCGREREATRLPRTVAVR